MSRPYRGPSEAQSNAEALLRRPTPYIDPHEASVRQAWDYRAREPANLREAVRMVRRAYADEVPGKLHEGPHSIGEGGTPKMTNRAEGYLFGSPSLSDARRNPETGEWDALSYFHSPFRAALDNLAHGDEAERKRGAIVQHVTIGGQGPAEAAIKEGVPSWCAKLVAAEVLSAFLRNLSDVKLNLSQTEAVA